MRLYPLYLDLTGAHALVAGAGNVGMRKILALVEAGAERVLVCDPCMPPATQEKLHTMPGVECALRSVTEHDIAGKTLVFAATDNPEENSRIASLCRAATVLCNIATAPGESTFHVPATARSGGIALAISTGGRSPALAKRIRQEAEHWLAERFDPLAVFLGNVRPLVLALGDASSQNADLFRNITSSDLGDALVAGDMERAREIARSLLPESLHGHIEDLLHDAR